MSVFSAVAGERNPVDGRILFPGLLVQSPCRDDGYVYVCVSVFIDSVTVWQWASSVGMWNVSPPASLTPLCCEDPL